MHFGDFNPLEVLANAAAQRGVNASNDVKSGCDEDKTGSVTETSKQDVFVSPNDGMAKGGLKPLLVQTTSPKVKPKAVPCVVKLVSNKGMRSADTTTKIVIPNKDGSSKTLTVVKINKSPHHPVKTLQNVLDSGKGDEDEGYCSRSSLDSPGQCTRSDSELCDREHDAKSPASSQINTATKNSPVLTPRSAGIKSPVPLTSVDRAHKPPKLVIVGTDSSNVTTNSATTVSNSVLSPNSTVLRTLLRSQKSNKTAENRALLAANLTNASSAVSCASNTKPGAVVSDIANDKNIPLKADDKIDSNCDTKSIEKTAAIDSLSVDVGKRNQQLLDSKAISDTAAVNKTDNVLSATDSSSKGGAINVLDSGTLQQQHHSASLPVQMCDISESERDKNSNSCKDGASLLAVNRQSVVLTSSRNSGAAPTYSRPAVISPGMLSAFKSPAAGQTHAQLTGGSQKSIVFTSVTPSAPLSHNKDTSSAYGRDDEEIIDVTSVDDSAKKACVSLADANARAAIAHPVVITTAAAPGSCSNQLQLRATSTAASSSNRRTASLAEKTIPVLINTANGKQLANVPVTSLLSASAGGSSAKPLTYLVMPPQAKGASLLMPQSNVTKSQALGLQKFQYILQDDTLKNSGFQSAVSREVSLFQQPKKTETWALLATVNHQNSSKSKTVPLLIKSPSINTSLGSALIQNSVVLSSRGPQSLIPKLVTSQANSGGAAVFQQNLVLASNRYPAQFVATEKPLGVASCNKDSLLNPNVLFTSQNSMDELGQDGDAANILASGRSTPMAAGRITPLHTFDSKASAENMINIKITGSKVTRAEDSRPRRASTSIGKFASLSASWSDFAKTSSGAMGSRSHMSSPIVFGSTTASPTSSLEPWSPLSLHIKSDSELDTTSDSITAAFPAGMTSRTAGAHSRRRTAKAGSTSGVDLSAIKSGLVNVGRLHPLIDHDYASFKEFNAEIQSSIIATTESKQKIEKYNQKAKALRSKETLFKLDKNFKQFKKRRYGHRGTVDCIRKARHEKLVDRTVAGLSKKPDEELSFLNLEQKAKTTSLPPKTLRTSRRASQSALERRTPTKMRVMPRRDSKSYVKITGSYQDDFVYYATKHSRGRARKESNASLDSLPAPKPVKKPSVCGVNVFDWYRDLSQTDKSMRFGVPESASLAQSHTTTTDHSINNALRLPLVRGGHTPVHESDVADLVMAMLPHDEFTPHSSDFNEASSLSQSVDGPSSLETIVTTEVNNESGAMNEIVMPASQQPESNLQQEQIDQVLSRLLNSMGETELDMLAEKLKNDMPGTSTDNGEACLTDVKEEPMDFKDIDTKPSDLVKHESVSGAGGGCGDKAIPEIKIEGGDMLTNTDAATDGLVQQSSESEPHFAESTDISALLGPYNQATNLSQVNASFDLDDINDDLLQSDITNMNALIGDLASTSGPSMTTSVDSKFTSPQPTDSPVRTQTANTTGVHLNNSVPVTQHPVIAQQHPQSAFLKSHLNRKFTTPSPPVQEQRPPELIVVSMFWNDLPGLMIDGNECVRLVDIHKQMLPAKDTGILKKRCQMMGLEILNCYEMEREFLIRYANAAKSKSCVVVSKDDAEALVNFYVNPRPRTAATNPRQSSTGSRDSSTERLTAPSGASTPSTESEFDYEVSRYAGGKGKGRAAHSSDKANTTPSLSGKAKRKQSPLAAPPPPPAYIPSSLEGASGASSKTPGVITNTTTFHAISTHSAATTSAAPVDPNVKRSNRTRNRKVNYAALNAGIGLSGSSEDGENHYPLERGIDSAFDEETRSAHESMGISLSTEQSHYLTKSAAPSASSGVGPDRAKLHGLNMRLPGISSQGLDQEKYSFVEELEIRKLRNKQKRKGLNATERRKLKQLKARLTVKVKKFKKKLDRLRKNNGSQLLAHKNFLVKKAFSDVSDCGGGETTTAAVTSGCASAASGCASGVIASPAKSILLPGVKKTVEELTNSLTSSGGAGAGGQLLPQEALVVKTMQDTKDVEFIDPAIQSQFVTTSSDSFDAKFVTIHEALAENQALLAKAKAEMSGGGSGGDSSTPLHGRRTSSRERKNSVVSPGVLRRVGERDRRPSERERERRSSEMSPPHARLNERGERRISESSTPHVKTTTAGERRQSGTATSPTSSYVTTPAAATTKKSGRVTSLPVLHRSSQRSRSQHGTLHLNLYRSREAACVQCDTCDEHLTVRQFLKHMHNQYGDEMIVRLGQKFELALTEPQPEQLKLWEKFEQKRELMDRSFERNKISISRGSGGGGGGSKASASPSNASQTKTNNRKVKACDVVNHAGIKVKTPAAQSALIRQSSVVITPLRTSLPISYSSSSKLSPGESLASSSPELLESPSSGTRHSSRTRKRKQLHPMESYVYSTTTSPGCGSSAQQQQDCDVKRQRLDSGGGGSVWLHANTTTAAATVATSATSTTQGQTTQATATTAATTATTATAVKQSTDAATTTSVMRQNIVTSPQQQPPPPRPVNTAAAALMANLAQTKSVVDQVAAISSAQEIER